MHFLKRPCVVFWASLYSAKYIMWVLLTFSFNKRITELNQNCFYHRVLGTRAKCPSHIGLVYHDFLRCLENCRPL